VGPQFYIIGSKNGKLLEMDSFLPPHTYLGSWQITRFGKKKFGTIGDALTKDIKIV
jgi:hypothetical protein